MSENELVKIVSSVEYIVYSEERKKKNSGIRNSVGQASRLSRIDFRSPIRLRTGFEGMTKKREGITMLFKKKQKEEEKEKVIISYTQKLGIVCIQSLEKYIEKYKIAKCYIIIPHSPHQNVIEYARNISLLEIIVSPDFKQEIEEIKKLYPGSTIEIINLEDFGERNMMRDAI